MQRKVRKDLVRVGTTSIRGIRDEWDSNLKALFSSARNGIVICAPFIGETGAECVRQSVDNSAISISVLTDLSVLAIAQGSTSPAAILAISQCSSNVVISHLPRVHAKVYIADSSRAVVCSANLTAGGLERDFEYGVEVSHGDLVREIEADIRDYASLGAQITIQTLEHLAANEDGLKHRFRKQIDSARASVKRQYHELFEEVEVEVLRSRLAGGALHTVFARTVAYLLRRYGPMTTPQIHLMVQSIHQDLCDDSVDRVIDGQRFGKKWKHAVRTAQQQLKKQGLIELIGDRWTSTQ